MLLIIWADNENSENEKRLELHFTLHVVAILAFLVGPRNDTRSLQILDAWINPKRILLSFEVNIPVFPTQFFAINLAEFDTWDNQV